MHRPQRILVVDDAAVFGRRGPDAGRWLARQPGADPVRVLV